MGGDFNEGPEGPAVRWLSDRMWDCFVTAGDGPGETFRADGPTARIDYLRMIAEELVRPAAKLGR